MLPWDGVVVVTVLDDRACELPGKFRAGLSYFCDRLAAARIVVAGMNAILVNRGNRAQDAEWVEKMDLMTPCC